MSKRSLLAPAPFSHSCEYQSLRTPRRRNPCVGLVSAAHCISLYDCIDISCNLLPCIITGSSLLHCYHCSCGSSAQVGAPTTHLLLENRLLPFLDYCWVMVKSAMREMWSDGYFGEGRPHLRLLRGGGCTTLLGLSLHLGASAGALPGAAASFGCFAIATSGFSLCLAFQSLTAVPSFDCAQAAASSASPGFAAAPGPVCREQKLLKTWCWYLGRLLYSVGHTASCSYRRWPFQ